MIASVDELSKTRLIEVIFFPLQLTLLCLGQLMLFLLLLRQFYWFFDKSKQSVRPIILNSQNVLIFHSQKVSCFPIINPTANDNGFIGHLFDHTSSGRGNVSMCPLTQGGGARSKVYLECEPTYPSIIMASRVVSPSSSGLPLAPTAPRH